MKASYLTIGLFLLAGFATGCDNISEDDRYIKVEKPAVKSPRTLLIMEFTGNNCPNCPTGAATVEMISEDEAPGSVIAVGLHPYGSHFTEPVFTIHSSKKQDLRSEAATAMYDYYQPNGFPSAVFSGLKSSMSAATGDWAQKASEALEVDAVVNLSASCEYEPETRNLTVDYSLDFLDYVNTKLNVTVWLMENDILGTQSMPNNQPTDLNYVHNHVLRTSLNGDWGEEIGSSFFEDIPISGTASTTLQEDWVAENCEVVVFVYRDDNKEVMQATKISIKD